MYVCTYVDRWLSDFVHPIPPYPPPPTPPHHAYSFIYGASPSRRGGTSRQPVADRVDGQRDERDDERPLGCQHLGCRAPPSRANAYAVDVDWRIGGRAEPGEAGRGGMLECARVLASVARSPPFEEQNTLQVNACMHATNQTRLSQSRRCFLDEFPPPPP